MGAVFRRELRSFFTNPIGYVVLAVLFCIHYLLKTVFGFNQNIKAIKKRRDFEIKSRSAKASLYFVQQSEQHAKKMKFGIIIKKVVCDFLHQKNNGLITLCLHFLF